MNAIKIGSPVADELYTRGRNRAAFYIGCPQRGAKDRRYGRAKYDSSDRDRALGKLGKQIASHLRAAHYSDPSLWTDAFNLATWTGEDAETTVARVLRILDAAQ